MVAMPRVCCQPARYNFSRYDERDCLLVFTNVTADIAQLQLRLWRVRCLTVTHAQQSQCSCKSRLLTSAISAISMGSCAEASWEAEEATKSAPDEELEG